MRESLKFLVTIGVLTFGIVAAAPAQAQDVPTVTVSSATLVNKGVALDVTVAITCQLGSTYQASMEINQRNGKVITRGGNFIGLGECTGTALERSVRIMAQQTPFKTGSALSFSNLTVCSEVFECTSYAPSEAIRITK